MSGRPILAADAPFAQAAAAGWSAEDLQWEALQEQAAQHAVAGRLDEAAPLWAQALLLARHDFAPDDPRLAASMANHAFGLRQAGDETVAAKLFEEAMTAWDASGPWLRALKIERRVRSSLYHLRMEAKHWETYEATARKRLQRFADEGREAIIALAAGKEATNRGVSRWGPEKPETYNDARKLLAAVLLTVRLGEIG